MVSAALLCLQPALLFSQQDTEAAFGLLPGMVQMNRQISRAIMTELEQQTLNDGSLPMNADAYRLIREAIEYDANNSDALFLVARYWVQHGNIDAGLYWAGSSIDRNTWELRSPIEAHRLVLELMLQKGMYDELFENYASRLDSYADYPDLLSLILEGVYRAGNVRLANTCYQLALQKFPEDPRFRALRIRYSQPLVIADFPWLQQRLSDNLPDGQVQYILSAAESYIFRMENGASKERLIQLYRQAGGHSALVELSEVENLDIGQREQALSELDIEALRENELFSAALPSFEFVSIESREESLQRLFQGDFTSWLDRDGNGAAELVLERKGGVIEVLKYDSDQNGMPERVVAFQNGVDGYPVPVELTLQQGQIRLLIRYRHYPAVSSAQLTRTDGELTEQFNYYLADEQLSFPAIEMLENDGATDQMEQLRNLLSYRLPVEEWLVPIGTLDRYVMKPSPVDDIETIIEDFSPYMYLVESRVVTPGSPQGSYIRQSRYEQSNLRVSRVDSDGDGRFEHFQYYLDGQLNYSVQIDDQHTMYIAQYDKQMNRIDQQLIDNATANALPAVLLPAFQSEYWHIPE